MEISDLPQINFLSQEFYDRLIEVWPIIWDESKKSIFDLLVKAKNYENSLLERAYELDHDFPNKLKNKIIEEKRKAMAQIEKEDEEWEKWEDIWKILKNV